ncbi:hypothetical protein KBB76_02855 [Candidatus Saccharibacteria bacterium]|jgi:hypothetical protein|nr:hypothetical protein [Candidatus Saccharibacteria bacterium]HPW48372.1 cytochrome b5 domain-containing protein [Candidatus Saccharibacteria bacterium]
MKLKNGIYIFIFIAIVFGLLIIVSFTTRLKKRDFSEPVITAKEYLAKDIKNHASNDDCYTAVNGVVYDLTAYISKKQLATDNICGEIDSDLEELNIKDIAGYKIGILAPPSANR